MKAKQGPSDAISKGSLATLKGMEVFQLNQGTILTAEVTGEERKDDGKVIKFVPLWRWLVGWEKW